MECVPAGQHDARGMEDVSIFLNGPSVQYETFDSEQFPLKELAKIFTLSEGEFFA